MLELGKFALACKVEAVAFVKKAVAVALVSSVDGVKFDMEFVELVLELGKADDEVVTPPVEERRLENVVELILELSVVKSVVIEESTLCRGVEADVLPICQVLCVV